jgi:hypothetical protein
MQTIYYPINKFASEVLIVSYSYCMSLHICVTSSQWKSVCLSVFFKKKNCLILSHIYYTIRIFLANSLHMTEIFWAVCISEDAHQMFGLLGVMFSSALVRRWWREVPCSPGCACCPLAGLQGAAPGLHGGSQHVIHHLAWHCAGNVQSHAPLHVHWCLSGGCWARESPNELLQHLLAAADRFALDRLKLLCASKLWDTVSVDPVFFLIDKG